MAFHAGLLLLDGFPWVPSLVSLGANSMYLFLLKEFPFISLTDALFVGSCRTQDRGICGRS